MLYDVIQRVSGETGIDLVQQRTTLVSLFNAASVIFHHELEANKMFREVTFVVPPNKIISLPSFVGEVKGMRARKTEQLIPLYSINVPRYTNNTHLYKIKNFRDLGDNPIQRNLTIIAPLTISCNAIETDNVTLKIAGQTNSATRIEEDILINATTVQTVNQFGPQIFSIACFGDRNNDIVIKDNAGTVIATLGNNQKKTRYKIMDVAKVFWGSDTTANDSFVDVCYKLPFVHAKNDTDSFAGGDDYDEAMISMMLHLNWKTQGGKQQEAMAELERAMQLLKSVKDGTEPGIKKKINWGQNRFYNLFTSNRYTASGNYYGELQGSESIYE